MKANNFKIFYLFLFFIGFSCNELTFNKEGKLEMMDGSGASSSSLTTLNKEWNDAKTEFDTSLFFDPSKFLLEIVNLLDVEKSEAEENELLDRLIKIFDIKLLIAMRTYLLRTGNLRHAINNHSEKIIEKIIGSIKIKVIVNLAGVEAIAKFIDRNKLIRKILSEEELPFDRVGEVNEKNFLATAIKGDMTFKSLFPFINTDKFLGFLKENEHAQKIFELAESNFGEKISLEEYADPNKQKISSSQKPYVFDLKVFDKSSIKVIIALLEGKFISEFSYDDMTSDSNPRLTDSSKKRHLKDLRKRNKILINIIEIIGKKITILESRISDPNSGIINKYKELQAILSAPKEEKDSFNETFSRYLNDQCRLLRFIAANASMGDPSS